MKFLIVIILLMPATLFAQTRIIDSLDNGKSVEDSIMYSKLKKKFQKSRLGKEIYNLLFRDVYNTNIHNKEISQIEKNPFAQYDGKIIGKITIKSLDIFGPSVNDTTRKGDRLERFASKALHNNTKEKVIRQSLLLFKEGDELNPQTLKDNERLLRANSIIHDARILIVPRKNQDWIVDIIVIIQDVWAIGLNGSFRNFNNFSLGVENKNFRGNAHNFLNRITWIGKDTIQRFGIRSIYTIPYLGRSFISTQAKLINERDLKQYSAQIYRPFLTTETRNAGSLEIGYTNIREYKTLLFKQIDSVFTYEVRYYYSDAWYGRSFIINKQQTNKNLIIALRRTNIDYLERPQVSLDSNKIYWNRTTWLGSIGFSNRNYQRDFLIYGYGRTEDVPVGNLFSLTLGSEKTEFGQRAYGGIQFAKGQYLANHKGYLYNLFNVGSYLKKANFQQGVIGFQSFYFSPLIKIGKLQTRHFINLGFTYGINRDVLDYLNISGKDGIIGVNSNALRGDKRLTLGYESVFFSSKSLLGFRMAYFAFANLGLVNLKDNSLFNSPLYQVYGLGIRFRNENLAIKIFQIRLGFYRNIPTLTSPFRSAFDSSQPLKLRDFDISAPSIIPLR